jgi:hypothetical protein
MKSLTAGKAAPMRELLTIDGKPFYLTLRPQGGGDWHWLIAAPGEIVLSGDAPSQQQALASAREAGSALARLSAGLVRVQDGWCPNPVATP